MSFPTRHHLNNALLRRVRQHGALTTLFGTGSPVSAPGTHTTPGSSAGEVQAEPGTTLVKATLITGQDTFANAELPPAMPAPGAPLTPEKTAIQQAERPFRSSQPQVHRPDPAPETGQPAPQTPETQDRSWQLLKRIFRKHQEQTPEPPGGTQQITTTQPVLAPHSDRTSRHSSENNTRAPDPQHTEQTPPHPPKAPLFESVGQVSKPAIPQDTHLDPLGQVSTSYPQGVPAGSIHFPPPSKTHVATPGTPHGTPIEPVGQVSTSYPQDVPATSAPPTKPMGESPIPSAQEEPAGPQPTVPGSVENLPAAVQTPQTNPAFEKVATDSYPHPAAAALPSDPIPLELHALPIEAVWPVQKRDLPQPNPLTTTGPHRIDPQPQPDLPIFPTPSQHEVTEASLPGSLARVPTGQPTRSQVEVIPPRRPRPAGQESSRPSALHHTRPFIPDEAQDTSHQESVLHASTPPTGPRSSLDSERLYAETSVTQSTLSAPKPSNPPAFQPSTFHSADRAPHTNLVSTAIGPLPADLWHLLKQPQPVSGERPQGSVPPRPPTDNSPTFPGPGGKQAQAVSQGDGLPLPAPQSTPGSLVQRSPAPDEPAASRATTHLPDQAETSQPTAPQLDLDELANRVYLDIKRKLAVEWERSRHRG